MTRFDPDNPLGYPLTEPQAKLLREVYALASATTTLVETIASRSWPPQIVDAHEGLLKELMRGRVQAVAAARGGGVPPRITAMAWMAGHRRQTWPHEVDPAGLDAALVERTLRGLAADFEQVADMGAVEIVGRSRPDVPEPAAVEGVHRNVAALIDRAAAMADVIGVTSAQWRQLWDLDGQALVARYMVTDAHALAERWLTYTYPSVAAEAELTVVLLNHVVDDATPPEAHTDSVALPPGAGLDALDLKQTEAAIDVALPGSEAGWSPTEPDPPTGTDPSPNTPDTEVDP
ncbi:hypothetical protein ACWDSJ_26165 [Nocardia sp. NPDC003482]